MPEETTKTTIVKRRRLRKRKRRPQPLPLVDSGSFDPLTYEEQGFQRRNRRPQRLDEYKHHWDVMEVENINKPYTRRRIAPDYFSSSHSGKNNAFVEEKAVPDLKTVLKKTEGTLSLSEVLQQKNLTLADLLKGDHHAISALTGSQIITEYKNPVEVPYKPQYNIRVVDLDNENESKLNRISAEVATEQNERKLSTPVIYKPNLESNHMIHNIWTTTQSSPAEKVPKRHFKLNDAIKKMKSKLPITSAKLHKLTTEKPEESALKTDDPPKAVEIKLSDLFGFSDYIKVNDSKTQKEDPEKMTINLDHISLQNNDSSSTTSKSIPDKLTIKTAKEEILEFLNNKENQAKLTNILKTRNMTTEELVELRERGSSQRHLADIFHNKTREPEPINETYVGEVMHLKSFPLNRNAKTTVEETKPIETVEKNEEYSVTSFPAIKIEIKENPEPKKQPFHVWKTLQGNIGDEYHENNNKKDPEDIQRIDDIENALAAAVNEKLNVEINENLYEEEAFFKWPTGIKSALFASLVIVGASLLIFLSILILFRWTQKTRRRLRHSNSFTGSKIKFPILEEYPKRNIRTIMCETLGRKKEVYTSKQSMSDSIWDHDQRPFQ